MRLEGHTDSRRSSLIRQHVSDDSFDGCDVPGWTAAGNRVSVRVKTDDGVEAGEFPIAQHVIEQSPLGGVNRNVESWRDKIHLTAQGPDPRRKRVDTYEAAAAFPDVKRDGGDELKGHH